MPEQLSEYFGERLAAIREALDLKQSDIGDKLGCSNGAYSLYERNKRQPTLSVLLNLCSVFGVSLDYLFGCLSPSPDLFAERLQTALATHPDKSLEEFINDSGLEKSVEKLLLSGKCFPNAKILKNLCRYLNCSADYLIGLSDSQPQPSSIGSFLNASTPRDPFCDLTPEQRIVIESSLKAFRAANAAAASQQEA